MKTRKNVFIIGLIFLFLVIGIIFVNLLFFFLPIPLIILLFLSIITYNDEEIIITVKREVSKERIYEDDEVEVHLDIENKGNKLDFIEIYDDIPKKARIVNGSNYAAVSLNKNEKISLKYVISCKVRGFYPVGPLKLRIRDYFDLFYREKTIEDTKHITVLPHLEDIKNIPIKSKANLFPGYIHARRAGIGTEFYGLRKYLPGDSFKHINWKSLAKFNDLMVNEFSLESTTDFIIIIDSRKIESLGSLKYNPLEYTIKAAGSLASFFLSKRDRVGIIAYGKEEGELNWVYPESGKKQLYKILEELVEIQSHGEYTFNNMINQISISMMPKKSSIIFISSLQNDDTIYNGIEQLTKYGFNILVLSPSNPDIEYSLQKKDEIDKVSYRILEFERKNFISRIRKTGAMVIDWDPAIPLEVSLEEVKKYQVVH